MGLCYCVGFRQCLEEPFNMFEGSKLHCQMTADGSTVNAAPFVQQATAQMMGIDRPKETMKELKSVTRARYKQILGIVERGHTILEYAATGGTGSLLCQWENALGGIVIGTVSTKEKAAQAKEDDFHHVIVNNANHRTKVELTKITSGNGVDVVFDSVGKDTFEGSLACLKIRGLLASFGQASGVLDTIPKS
ncbi:quinone oxidoreductase 1 [Artemisia annua]|uniref:Quinone oxidoreductase 1 n=1 Tax=Artemisia annua TaxID=35608 RepID=A0A2U1NLN1_ARTAN|nr:quinone oxidoreductase 1 [Artemisia annua]